MLRFRGQLRGGLRQASIGIREEDSALQPFAERPRLRRICFEQETFSPALVAPADNCSETREQKRIVALLLEIGRLETRRRPIACSPMPPIRRPALRQRRRQAASPR